MTNEEYMKLQDMWLKVTGIKEGSWVKVTRMAETHESGWDNSWWPDMNRYVGNIFKVDYTSGDEGICLDAYEHYRFPFFILEPAEEPKLEKHKFMPFEKVLVRDEDSTEWRLNLFSHTSDNDYPFNCISSAWEQCIPYAGHETLLNTSDEPEDWSKYYDK